MVRNAGSNASGDDSEENDSNDSSEEESESGSNGSNEEDSDDEDEGDPKVDAKHNLVESDLMEIRRMMEEMDKIKMRLQFRLTKERENGMSMATCPSRRQSSVKDILVPSSSISAGVQTVWDMSRMFVMEKVVEHSVDRCEEKEKEKGPIETPPAELSLQDLAKTFGIVNTTPTSTSPILSRRPSAIPAEEVRTPSVGTGSNALDPLESQMAPTPSLWENLVMKTNDSAQLAHSTSSAATFSPPKQAASTRSSILDEFDTIHRTYSPPSSPVHGSSSNPWRESTTRTLASHPSDQEKTVAQKEMEAIQSLLF